MRSRESKGYPNSRFDRGVGLRGSGRYPLKPSIFASLLETKGYPEHTAQPATMAARSSRESHKCIFGLNNLFKNYDSFVLCSTQSCTYIFATMFLIETFLKKSLVCCRQSQTHAIDIHTLADGILEVCDQHLSPLVTKQPASHDV